MTITIPPGVEWYHTVGFLRSSPCVLSTVVFSSIVGPSVCISSLRTIYSNLGPLSRQTACFLAIEFLTGFEFNPQSIHGLQTHPPFQQLRRETCKIVSSSKYYSDFKNPGGVLRDSLTFKQTSKHLLESPRSSQHTLSRKMFVNENHSQRMLS